MPRPRCMSCGTPTKNNDHLGLNGYYCSQICLSLEKRGVPDGFKKKRIPRRTVPMKSSNLNGNSLIHPGTPVPVHHTEINIPADDIPATHQVPVYVV